MLFERCYWSTFYFWGFYTSTVCMCACLISVITELMTEGFNIIMKGVNMDGFIFVLSFANNDGNNDSIYHEQSTHCVILGMQCLI